MLLALFLLASNLPAQTAIEPSVEYDVVFDATWSAKTHPVDFPANAHFSGLVGGLHNQLVTFWESGRTASQGIQNMAELGAQNTLLSEVNKRSPPALRTARLSGSGIGGGTGRSTLRFRADSSHPLVTLASMVAPSPDWFVGVHGLSLLDNGAWVAQKTVGLYPYDAGTDSGTTFTSPDQVTVPRGMITSNRHSAVGSERLRRPTGDPYLYSRATTSNPGKHLKPAPGPCR